MQQQPVVRELSPDTPYSAASDGLVFSFTFTSRQTCGREACALALRQVHGIGLQAVRPEHAGRAADGWIFEGPREESAAIFVADCLPVALFAPEAGRAAIAHCGHRGLSGRILYAAAARLGHGRLQAWLGPCIGRCCYQVQADVADRFAAWPESLAPHPDRGWRLDLQRAAALQLGEIGAEVGGAVPDCTHCAPGRYHSFRRDGAGSDGRQSLVATLRRAS
jgi:hypothetical protein